MDRKKYLLMCQENAVSPKSVVVTWKGVKYFPMSYSLWFEKDGTPQHRAVLKDVNANSVVGVKLDEVLKGEEQ